MQLSNIFIDFGLFSFTLPPKQPPVFAGWGNNMITPLLLGPQPQQLDL